MKNLIIALTLMASFTAFAAETCSEQVGSEDVAEQMEIKTDVPAHLKGATIIVRTADGRESSVPAERFKVVPRKQQFITTRTERKTVKTCMNSEHKMNRISVLGGHGSKPGLNRDNSNAPNVVEVESRRGLVGGAQYQRMLNDTLSVGGQVQTNKTGSVMIGVDF